MQTSLTSYWLEQVCQGSGWWDRVWIHQTVNRHSACQLPDNPVLQGYETNLSTTACTDTCINHTNAATTTTAAAFFYYCTILNRMGQPWSLFSFSSSHSFFSMDSVLTLWGSIVMFWEFWCCFHTNWCLHSCLFHYLLFLLLVSYICTIAMKLHYSWEQLLLIFLLHNWTIWSAICANCSIQLK